MQNARWLLCLVFIGAPCSASAKTTVTCEKVEKNAISIDGLFTDWELGTPTRLNNRSQILKGASSWSGPDDMSAEVTCLYDSKNLYFRIMVKDDYIVRQKRVSDPQDHVMFLFKAGTGVRSLAFFPGDGRNKPAMGWMARKRKGKKTVLSKAEGMNAVVIRLPSGYAVEASLGSSHVPSYGPGSPAIMMSIQVADSDSRTQPSIDTLIGTGGDQPNTLGRMEIKEASNLLLSFLKERGLGTSDIKLNVIGNFVTGKALERAIIAGRYLAIMGGNVTGGGWYYLTFPVTSASDVLRFAVRDMDGDGGMEILVRLRQTGGNKLRELYLVYRYKDTGGLGIIFGHEVVHKMGDRLLINNYRYIRKKGGWQMEFWMEKCVGWTKENHQAVPPKDIQGILTPWSSKTKVMYKFTSEGFEETD